jgi:hypothetical protein
MEVIFLSLNINRKAKRDIFRKESAETWPMRSSHENRNELVDVLQQLHDNPSVKYEIIHEIRLHTNY